jgi:hypothetical protein
MNKAVKDYNIVEAISTPFMWKMKLKRSNAKWYERKHVTYSLSRFTGIVYIDNREVEPLMVQIVIRNIFRKYLNVEIQSLCT